MKWKSTMHHLELSSLCVEFEISRGARSRHLFECLFIEEIKQSDLKRNITSIENWMKKLDAEFKRADFEWLCPVKKDEKFLNIHFNSSIVKRFFLILTRFFRYIRFTSDYCVF